MPDRNCGWRPRWNRTRRETFSGKRALARGGWVYVGGRAGNKPPQAEKTAITGVCEKFITEVLRPRFLPEVRPTELNYPVALYGKWHGNRYRFITRYRSDDPRPTNRNSTRRSLAWNVSAGIALTCPGTGTRGNGSACLNGCR
jgi:hypothetical protein